MILGMPSTLCLRCYCPYTQELFFLIHKREFLLFCHGAFLQRYRICKQVNNYLCVGATSCLQMCPCFIILSSYAFLSFCCIFKTYQHFHTQCLVYLHLAKDVKTITMWKRAFPKCACRHHDTVNLHTCLQCQPHNACLGTLVFVSAMQTIHAQLPIPICLDQLAPGCRVLSCASTLAREMRDCNTFAL